MFSTASVSGFFTMAIMNEFMLSPTVTRILHWLPVMGSNCTHMSKGRGDCTVLYLMVL